MKSVRTAFVSFAALVFLSSAPWAGWAAGFPPGLAAYWPGENDALDATGANPGTLANGTAFVDGRVNRAFHLDGVDDYVDVGPLPAVAGAEALTVTAWVRRAHGDFSVGGIVGQWNTGGAGGNRFLLYNSEGALAGQGGFVVEFAGGGGVSVVGTTPMPVGEWVHLAAVWRGSDGFIGLYKNGVLESTTTGPTGKRLNNDGVPTAKLGEWGVVRTPVYKWPGDLDEAAVFNRALSAAEIQRVFGQGVLGLPAETANDIAEGTELLIQGSGAKGHVNFETDAFRNGGSVRLESINGGYTSGLTVWGGVLTNAPTGVVTINPGSGGARFIRGGLWNLGTVNVNDATEFGGADGWFRNEAAWNIAAGQGATLAGGGTRFEQAAGVLQQDGGFTVDGTRFLFSGGEVKGGYVYVDGGSLELGRGVPGEGRFILTRSTSSLTGDIGPQTEVWVRGDGRGGHTTAKAAAGFANRGTLRFESVNGGYASSLQAEGTLTNETAGRIVSNGGAGGARQLITQLRNEGLVTLNDGLRLGRTDARHLNRGVFDIKPGQSLVLDAGPQTFRQEAGAINIAGGFDGSGITFEFAGGDITGGVYLDGSRLSVEPSATGPGYFYLTRSSSRLAGSLQPGQTVQVRGDGRGSHTQITVEPGFVNRGEVKLESANGGYNSSLALTEGSFRNGPGGRVAIEPGAGGPRNFTAQLFNQGAFEANFGVNFGRDNATHTNRGTFTVSEDVGLRMDKPGQTFRQEAGRINVIGGFDASEIRFDFAGGEIQGTPYLDGVVLNVVPGSSGPASFILTRSASRLEGAIHSGQTVWLRGDNRGSHTDLSLAPDFPNRGTLRLASVNGGYNTSFHQDSGAFRNLAGGRLVIDPGAGGPRHLTTELRNDGDVAINYPTTLGRDSAVHVNRGTWTVAEGVGLTISGANQTLRLESGRFELAGGGSFTDLRFEFLGGVVTGTPYLNGCALFIHPANTSPGDFIVTRSTTVLSGELHAGQSIWVRGDNTGSHTDLTLAPEFANGGTLRLASVQGGYNTTVSKPAGTFINRSGGRIVVDPGSGGPRSIRANLVNEGTLEVNQPLTLGTPGGVQVNRGLIQVAEGVALGFSGAGQTFRQEAGELRIGGSFSGTDQRVEYLGGLIEGPVYLVGSTLVLGSGAGPGGDFTVTRSDTQVFGGVPAGGSLTVRSDNQGGHSAVLAPEGFVNAGYFQLVSVQGGYNSQFNVTEGQFINEAGGIIEVNPGSGGPRFLGTPLVNHGEFRVNYPVTLGRGGDAGVSDGVIRLAEGATLTLNGSLQVSGGMLAGNGTFNGTIVSRGTVSPGASAGSLRFLGSFTQQARGVIDLEVGGTDPATFDRVNFGGAAQLDGVVRVRLIDGYTPASGESLALIAGRFTGSPRLELPALNAGLRWRADFANGLTLSVEESPAPALAIKGRVTDSQAKPLAGVGVQAVRADYRGLVAELWSEQSTNGAPVVRRLDATVDFDWGNGVPDPGIGGDNFYVRWTGELTPQFSETYTLSTVSDDGSWLWIDDQLVVDNGGLHGMREIAGNVTLEAGRAYRVRIEMHENGGGAGCRFLWSSASQAREVVPASALRPVGDLGGLPPSDYVTVAGLTDTSGNYRLPVPAGEWSITVNGVEILGLEPPAAQDVVVATQDVVANFVLQPSTTPRFPDLVIADVVAPTTAVGGQTIDVSWLSRNQGDGPAQGPWRETVLLARQSGGFGAQPVGALDVSGELAAGASVPRRLSVTLPAGLVGRYWLLVRADATLQVDEGSREGNNLTASADSIDLLIGDLVVDRVTGPAQIKFGESAEVSWVVRNAGGARVSLPWQDAVSLSTIANGGGVTLVQAPAPVALAPGESYTNQAVVTIPLAGQNTPGPRFLLVRADSGGEQTEADEANNLGASAAVDVQAPPPPDLVVTEVLVPAVAPLGQPVSLVWSVKNVGLTRAVAPWQESLRLATDAAGGNAFDLITVRINDPLEPGAEVRRTNSVIFPASQVGERFLLVTTDVADDVAETGPAENNTRASETAFTIAAPDLVVESVTAPVGTFGGAITVTWVGQNIGNAPAEAVWLDRIFLERVDVRRLLHVQSPAAANAIPPGGRYTNSVTLPLPLESGSVAGPHRLVVVTDAQADLLEILDDNNSGASAEGNLSLPPLPDLTITGVTFPANSAAGADVDVIWTVRNAGTAPAHGPWQETVSLSADATPGADFPLVGLTVEQPLAAGASVTRTNRVRIPASLAGLFTIFAGTDVGGAVVESSEDNNFGAAVNRINLPSKLTLELAVGSVSEGDVPPVLRGRLFRTGSVGQPLTVTLTSGDTNEIAVPETVVIPAGSPVVDVNFSIKADGVVDGSKNVLLTADADGFFAGTASVVVQDIDRPRLRLTLDSTNVVEGLTVAGTVSRPKAEALPLDVNVQSSLTDVLVPTVVTIPANAASVVFTVIAMDDTVLDFAREAVLTVNAAGHLPAAETVRVQDNDNPGLSVVVEPGSLSEAGGGLAARAIITRTNVTAKPLFVQLRVSDDSEAVVQPTAVIRSGAASAEVFVSAVNDNVVDGPQEVELRAFVLDGGTGGVLAEAKPAKFTVTDDDGPSLRLILGGTLAREGRNPALTGVVTRNSDPAAPLVVQLGSSDTTEATVPATVEIPAGATSTTFPITTLNDGVVDGNQRVNLTASADGFAPATAQFTVSDGDLPDLVVSEVTAATTGVTRGLFEVGYRVTNQGFDRAVGSIVQKVILSRDPVLDDQDSVLDETPFNAALPIGESFSRTLTLFLPGDTGTFWLFVTADAGNAVREALEDNNTTRAPAPLRIDPAYMATVETDITTAPAGTAIPLKGKAVRPNGTPAAGELVNVHVVLNGARRTLSALTTLNGDFTATFQPLPSEAGSYTVGAAHPGVAEAPVQDRFNLLGLRITPNYAQQTVLPGSVARSEFELVNLSAQPLTGITAKSGAVDGLNVIVETPAQLAPGASAKVTVISSVPEPRDAAGRFVVQFTSAEGAKADLTIDYVVELPQARLVATPRALETGMVRGRQTLVEFEVVNTGGADSGPLNITLPEIPWLKSATATPIPPVPPGGRVTVALQLTPDATVPLDIYEGRIAVHNSDVGVAVPFKFRHVSDAVGDVAVSVVDELTYYGAGGPKVAGAQVVLRDPFTGEARFTGVSDTNGLVRFAGVAEGSYNLDVTAPKHDNFLQTVAVAPGKTNEFTAFIRTQLVRYNWKVEEIDIEEKAKITLETIFETTVPVPVVTIEPNSIDLTGITADEHQVELKFTNHGLIAAQDVRLRFADGSKWSVHPVTEDIGVIPAKSSLTVPVIFRRIDEGANANGQIARQGVRRNAGGSSGGCDGPTVGVDWRLICGPFGVAYWAPVPIIDLGLCPPLASGPGGGGGGLYIPVHIPGPPSGGGGNGRGFAVDIGWGNRGFATYSATNDCSCLKGGFAEKCIAAEGGFKGELKGFAEKLANTALQSLAYTRLLGVEVKVSGSGKLCTCCAEVDGQGIVGLKAQGSLTAQIEAKVFFGPSVKWSQEIEVAGLSGAEGEFFAGGGVEIAATGYASLSASTECLFENPEICIEGGLSSKLFAGIKASGKVTGTLASGQKISAGVEGVLGVEGGFTARSKTCTKNGVTTVSNNDCRDAIVAKGSLQISYEKPANESEVGDVSGFGGGGFSVERELLEADCPGEKSDSMPVLLTESDAATVARWFGQPSPAAFAATVAPQAAGGAALAGDATGPQLSSVLIAGVPAKAATGSTVKEFVFDRTAQPSSAADWARAASLAEKRIARAAKPRRAADAANGVCAQVRLQIEQEAVVTRKAIGATLELINESEDTELRDVGVTINIYDAAGNLANDRFIILAPELTRLTPTETTSPDRFVFGGMALKLAPATTGSARWVILPRDEAAPDSVQQYFVGGVLAYTAGGVPGTAELAPGQVRVYPNAKLDLKYFHQRDVFSDDPFTDAIEPSLPFTLGVMVHNKGKGVARNMHITSAQPKIVENVKGLLIDFSIIATEVAGKSLTPSLTAEFGDIQPGDTAIGRWLLKSSLQGLFIDYKATLEHEDRFGQAGASVFDGVEIHELIHQVEAQGGFADGKPDFLVNDLKDDEDLPDTVHLSDATTAPVAVVRAASPDGVPTANDLEVVLTAPLPNGFAYLRVPDPANGQFRLAGVKRSDGRVLPVDVNAWVTDRTFLGMGKRPRYENVLHLFDHDSTGSYTLTYARDERVPDLSAPHSRVASLPANSPAQIAVSWAGEDDAFGTGVGSYDLFVSVNGGPFQRWLTNTRATSGLYPGAAGRTYAFYSRARDVAGNVEGAPLAPQAVTFTTGNSAPTVDPLVPVTVDEGGTLAFTVSATDADIPADAITYGLANAPAGMTIDPATGRVSWQTSEADGPRTYSVTVRATDNGSPSLTGEAVVQVTVRELNTAPTLEPVAGTLPAKEGELLSVNLVAADADLPAQPLRFRLADGAPAGATVNASGVLQWTPGETDGGRTVAIGVVVSDGQSPELTAATTVTVQVAEANSPPVLAPIKNQVVWEGDLLSLQFLPSDPDLPAQSLTFSQGGNDGLGTALDPVTGAFSWLPVEAEVPNTNHITITVTDDATPTASTSRTFTLVGRALKQGLNRPNRFANGDVSFRFKGTAGRRYLLEGTTDFTEWTPIREFVADPAIFTITDQTSAAFPWRYFRARAME